MDFNCLSFCKRFLWRKLIMCFSQCVLKCSACFCVVFAGMGIQTVVFYICFLFLVFLIIIPVFYGRNLIAFTIAGKAWWVGKLARRLALHSILWSTDRNRGHIALFVCLRPVWVTLTLATALQHVTAEFAFIKKEGGTRDLNNRFVKLIYWNGGGCRMCTVLTRYFDCWSWVFIYLNLFNQEKPHWG